MKYGVTKKEYVKLIRRTETALDRELKKPDSERDNELVSECLESLSYYRAELDRLSSSRSSVPAFRFARSALAVLLVLAVTFALGATVAEAAGLRVWTAIIKRDAGYLRVDYVPDQTSAPTERAVWEDAEKSFFSYGEYKKELESSGFSAFLGEWEGYSFMEAGVRSTKDEYYTSFTLRKDSGCIRVRMIAKPHPVGTTSVWGLREEIPAVFIDVNGISAAYQTDGDYAFATWQDGNRIFSVSVYEDPSVTEAFLRAFIG